MVTWLSQERQWMKKLFSLVCLKLLLQSLAWLCFILPVFWCSQLIWNPSFSCTCHPIFFLNTSTQQLMSFPVYIGWVNIFTSPAHFSIIISYVAFHYNITQTKTFFFLIKWFAEHTLSTHLQDVGLQVFYESCFKPPYFVHHVDMAYYCTYSMPYFGSVGHTVLTINQSIRPTLQLKFFLTQSCSFFMTQTLILL